MLYEVKKEFGKYKTGMTIDLDRLAEVNYNEYVYLYRKIDEGAIVPVAGEKAIEKAVKNKAIDRAPQNKAIDKNAGDADNNNNGESKKPVIKVKGE